MYSCQKQALIYTLGEAGTLEGLAALVKESCYYKRKERCSDKDLMAIENE
jgi:hypothetical protein